MAADVHAEHDLAGAESVRGAGVRSLLSVPLLDPLAMGEGSGPDGSRTEAPLDAVDAAAGNITRAAERLDLHPNHLHRLIRNLGLREELDSR